MDWNLIAKIILAIIGLFAAASIIICIKIKTDKTKTKQKIKGDGNIQAGRDINIK